MAHLAAIALGSNLPCPLGGGPEENLRRAIARLGALGTVLEVSSFHATAPVGYMDQPDFVNAALVMKTQLPAWELMCGLFEIERSMGRVRTGVPPKGPRIIDLDLLLYDDVVLSLPDLTIPHPAMHERRFVLEPLAEIAPEWMHPVLGETVGELLRKLG